MHLKETFNINSAEYEKFRPKYPKDILDQILKFKKLDKNNKILEIGSATGLATELFADLGLKIHCIDIGEDLVNIAKDKFKNHPNITFEISKYEDKNYSNEFDLIFSATAYHWIDQPVGDKNTVKALKDDGIFTLFRYMHINRDQGYFKESQDIYRKFFDGTEPENPKDNLMNREYFDVIYQKEYPWQQTYSANEYISLLSTYSDHMLLSEDHRNMLFSELKELILNKYNGKVEKDYKTVLEIGKSL